MEQLRTMWLKVRSCFQRREVKREIDEELRFHLEQRTAENIAAGMAPEEAAREARRRFGNFQNVREECREACGASFAETVLQDLRFGWRTLRRSPGFTIVAALTLALGVGANLAMFSVLRPLLFHPLPYPDSERLVRVYRTSPQSQAWSHSYADFVDHRAQNHVFKRLAAYRWEGFNYGAPGQTPERLSAVHAGAELFSLLGIPPMFGRVFTAEEEQPGQDQVAVLTHGFWASHCSGDTNIVGRTLRFDGQAVTVIGVMPASFDFPMLFGNFEAWRPLVITPDGSTDRENRYLEVIGQLKPGVTLAQAQADMSVLAAQLAAAHPEYDGGCGLRVVRLVDSLVSAGQRRMTWFLFGLTSFVLLIACANLANLQLARNTRRSHELAVRAALGAGQRRLVRQLLTESLLISVLGSGLGLLFAAWCDAILIHNVPQGLEVAFDFHVLACSLACCLMTVLAFGTAPAWLAARVDVQERLKESVRSAQGSRSQHRLRRGLIVSQVALALMLLAGAGATVRVLQRFTQLDPGWQIEGVVTAGIAVAKEYYPPERRLALFGQLEERLAGLPGVVATSFTTDLPVVSFWNTQPLRIDDRPVPPRNALPVASCPTVGSAYFRALGIRLREGRCFSPADKLGRPPVTIINESMARQFWPGQDPLGKRISIGDPTNPQWMEIVGVVGDVRFPADPDRPETCLQVYRPWAQDDIATGGTLVLRTAIPPESVVPALRRAVAEVEPGLPVFSVRTARQAIDGMLRGSYLVAGLLGAFGILGLLLASIGIYGVTSQTMAERTGEIGIRMALGARQRDVLWLVLRQGLQLGSLGALVGFAGSLVVIRILDVLIPAGSLAREPVRLAGVPLSGWLLALGAAVLLVLITLIACYLPARRAASVNPMSALRYE